MKSNQTIIRKNHMEQLHFITKLLDIKDPNIKIFDTINRDTHKEIIAKLAYIAPSCPNCRSQMKKYDFQKPSKIPYLETTGMPTRILLKKALCQLYRAEEILKFIYIVDFMVVLVYYYFQLFSEISPLLSQISFPLSHCTKSFPFSEISLASPL